MTALATRDMAWRPAGHAAPPAAPPVVPAQPLRVALVGNPNCGKSTLFNALTGRREKVANFPGVTVERVEGRYEHGGATVMVLDLPGTYSLSPDAPDEALTLDVVHGRHAGTAAVDVFVVVLDAENLERNLYLATEVLELGRPTVIVLNRMDRLAAAGMKIDVFELIDALGAVVVPTVASTRAGIDRLRHVIARAPGLPLAPVPPARVAGAGDAERRYGNIAAVMRRAVTRDGAARPRLSDRVDAVLLHRVWGPVVFVAVMAIAFQALFTVAAPVAALLQSALGAVASVVRAAMPAGELRSLLVDGVIGGVGSVIVFVPQIALLFLCIGVLEDSGYLSRAAFVMDRFVRPFGLQGKSFIPLLSGFACAVPAILATRTIPQTRERLATIMVVPLMSCSARLPVYALLIAAFVPPATVAGAFTLQGVALLAMYLLGTVAALASAAVFRRTLLRGATRALILEMPPYAVPTPRVLFATVSQRVGVFVRRAGTVIFAISVLLWALGRYPRPHEHAAPEVQLAESSLGRVGRAVEPAVRPLGLDWKVGVAMVASFAAREVFVSTMATMYGVESGDGARPALAARLRAAKDAAGRPAYTIAAALGLLAFYVFALMCTSTLAVTVRETGGGWRGAGWAALQFSYMLALAWGCGFLVYRAGLALGLGVAA